MKLSCVITVKGDGKRLIESISPDLKKRGDRSSISLVAKEDNAVFNITATDAIALKAACSSITNLLAVYEKVKE